MGHLAVDGAGGLAEPSAPTSAETAGPRAARPRGDPTVDQNVALSPQAQEPEEFGFSMEKPEASKLSFQSITEPWM